MPNRILKESIRTSRSVNAMSDFQFRLWAYLITYVDDFGRGSADPELLKGFVFPRRKGITEDTIKKALADLANTGSVILYEVGGEPYLCFPNWGEHQTIRNKMSKFPAPEEGIIKTTDNCKQLNAVESNCKQLNAVAPVIQSNPESRIQNPESESNPRTISAEPQAASTPPVIFLPLNDGTDYPISREQCHEWAGLYPAVNVIQQLRQMRGWLDANPEKRKTKRGINAFVVRWLGKVQDRGGDGQKPSGSNGNGRKSWTEICEELMEESL